MQKGTTSASGAGSKDNGKLCNNETGLIGWSKESPGKSEQQTGVEDSRLIVNIMFADDFALIYVVLLLYVRGYALVLLLCGFAHFSHKRSLIHNRLMALNTIYWFVRMVKRIIKESRNK